ncbi:MAG: hypothetical protein ACK5CY_01505 [Bacteroidia bacterium]
MFLIPLKYQCLLCAVENDEIKIIQRFPIPAQSQTIIVNNTYIVSLFEGISIFDLQGSLLKNIKCDVMPTCIHSKGPVVYLGGQSDKEGPSFTEFFSMINLESRDYAIKTIDIPISMGYGKAIDDILILGNRLILVDNLIYPKYLFEYDISIPNNPIHIKTNELENNGTYEHIVRGDINERWMVLLSATFGMGGASDHITIAGKKKGILSIHRNTFEILEYRFGKSALKFMPNAFNDICLINDILYVLMGVKMYRINLNGRISKSKLEPVKSRLRSIKKLIKTPCKRLIAVSDQRFECVV